MKKKKRKLTWKELIIVLILGLLFSLGSFTLAKYVIEEFHSYYLNAKHFYFTSNRLKRDNPIYLVNNWSGVGSFTISFDLLSLKNSYVYTDYDIPYTVTVSCPTGVTCSVDKPTGTIYSASQTHSDTITVSVNPSRSYGENEQLEVQLTAASTSPYVEEIKARYRYVVGKQGITYEIEDEANRPYLMFKITNAINYCTVVTAFGNYSVNDEIESSVYRSLSASDKANCECQQIALSFNPNVILLDTTSSIIDSSTYTNTTIGGTSYINSLTFFIDPVSTMAIKFYKVNVSQNYTYPVVNSTSIITVTTS